MDAGSANPPQYRRRRHGLLLHLVSDRNQYRIFGQVQGHRWAIEDSFETTKNSGSTTMKRAPGTAGIATSRSSCSPSPCWPQSVIMRMPRRPKKRTAERRRQRLQSLIAIDPLVGPGNPPHRHPPCAKTDQPRQHHCMVDLATRASSRRSESAHQTKYATVMLKSKGDRPTLPGRQLQFDVSLGPRSGPVVRSHSRERNRTDG
jgi:hypothetical protein